MPCSFLQYLKEFPNPDQFYKNLPVTTNPDDVIRFLHNTFHVTES